MDEQAFFQALDRYDGPIIASHSNPRRLTNNTNRHLSDEMIRALVQHDGVIGTLIFNKFLLRDWEHGDPKDAATVDTVVTRDRYGVPDRRRCAARCHRHRLRRRLRHASTPAGFDTVADLQIIAPALERRGYSAVDVELIMNGNWVRVLKGALV